MSGLVFVPESSRNSTFDHVPLEKSSLHVNPHIGHRRWRQSCWAKPGQSGHSCFILPW
jgi:hypothetical protein